MWTACLDLLYRSSRGLCAPHQESLEYYKNKYNLADDFIVNHTILVNKHNMDILLNDEKYPFGNLTRLRVRTRQL